MTVVSTSGQRRQLRGEPARHYLLGSLALSARHEADLPLLAPRALRWYRDLLELGISVPFALVLDLGYLFLHGEAFGFRSFFARGQLDPTEQRVREAYETRVLVRRLQEANLDRLRRLLNDSDAPDLAVSRALELSLRPLAADLPYRFALEDAFALHLDLDGVEIDQAREAFESDQQTPGLFTTLFAAIAAQGDRLDLDRTLHDEDFYELAHIRIFPRESLREVARRIKMVERLLGPSDRPTGAALRERALADTRLESIGTYPTGGIAELTTRGPVENLMPSELIYLERDQPIDAFLVRFAENELLKYLRDSAVLRMMRRTVLFWVEDCAEFTCPVTMGRELYGTKIIRCLMGLSLRLLNDLLQVFEKDDIRFGFKLFDQDGGAMDTAAERREILEVLHLLFHEKEEQGTMTVELSASGITAEIAAMEPEPERERTVVVMGRPSLIERARQTRPPAGTRMVLVAIETDTAADTSGLSLDLATDPLRRLQAMRRALLEAVIG